MCAIDCILNENFVLKHQFSIDLAKLYTKQSYEHDLEQVIGDNKLSDIELISYMHTLSSLISENGDNDQYQSSTSTSANNDLCDSITIIIFKISICYKTTR